MLFPRALGAGPRTAVTLADVDGALPVVSWLGATDRGEDADGFGVVANGPGLPLLGEHARGRFTRPHLRGHRVGGGAWTTWFRPTGQEVDDTLLVVRAEDRAAGLALVYELEAVVGGGLRGRATVTNVGEGEYVVDGLEVVLPLADDHVDLLDFTGRHERERTPQRHTVDDGLWLREGLGGRPGLDAATMVVAGTAGFSTTRGSVVGVHVGWSGNSVLRVERTAAHGATIGGGELLLPGEVVLPTGSSYVSPWVYVAASDGGLDGLAAVWHEYQRSLDAHPAHQPVVLNVWEAVFFDHDLDRLRQIADRGASVGVERFVLDDGWFHDRRDDTAGLGDWMVDEQVWPDGLDPLIEHVRGLGMEFGLWFEPEMVNPDSDLFRAHPEWILSAGEARTPLLHRNQQVLDLTRPEVVDHLFDRVHAVLSEHAIDYVKWDHNRDLLEAGSGARGGAPAAHAQTLAFYDLLDRLRAAHPDVAWESCASGGGRIDLGVLERVQRVWTSDMTDALARQSIQRWTAQLVAPEYVGAHVSATTSHTTHRTLPAGLPGRDGPLRGVRHRVGPHRGLGRGAGLPRRLDRTLQAAPPAAALRARRPARVQRPGRAAARGRRGGPRVGAGGARAARRVGAQPRRPGPRARPRTGPRLRPRVGGPGRRAGDEHVGVAARDRPDRRAAGERCRPRDTGFLDAADAAGDGDAGASGTSGTRLISACVRLRHISPAAGLGRHRRPAALTCPPGDRAGRRPRGCCPWVVAISPGACALAPGGRARPARPALATRGVGHRGHRALIRSR